MLVLNHSMQAITKIHYTFIHVQLHFSRLKQFYNYFDFILLTYYTQIYNIKMF